MLALLFFRGGGGAVQSPPTLSGGGGKRYGRFNTDNLDLEKWARRRKRIEVRIEEVSKKIEAKQEEIDLSPSFKRLQILRKQIEGLQAKLSSLIDLLEELKQEHERAEAVTLYLAYKRFH